LSGACHCKAAITQVSASKPCYGHSRARYKSQRFTCKRRFTCHFGGASHDFCGRSTCMFGPTDLALSVPGSPHFINFATANPSFCSLIAKHQHLRPRWLISVRQRAWIHVGETTTRTTRQAQASVVPVAHLMAQGLRSWQNRTRRLLTLPTAAADMRTRTADARLPWPSTEVRHVRTCHQYLR